MDPILADVLGGVAPIAGAALLFLGRPTGLSDASRAAARDQLDEFRRYYEQEVGGYRPRADAADGSDPTRPPVRSRRDTPRVCSQCGGPSEDASPGRCSYCGVAYAREDPVAAGVLTINEVRARENLPPLREVYGEGGFAIALADASLIPTPTPLRDMLSE